MYYNNASTPTAIDRDFYIAAYGRRAVGSTGAGFSSPAAIGDVRNRLSVGDVESQQHRNKLFTYYNSLRTAFAAQHTDGGEHNTQQVPIGVALTAPSTGGGFGDIIWLGGAIEHARYNQYQGENLSQWLDFRVASGWRWTGARAIVQQNTTTLALTTSAIPLIAREYHPDSDRRGRVALGDDPSTIAQVGLIIYGVRSG